jgi:hypothetical protein
MQLSQEVLGLYDCCPAFYLNYCAFFFYHKFILSKISGLFNYPRRGDLPNCRFANNGPISFRGLIHQCPCGSTKSRADAPLTEDKALI